LALTPREEADRWWQQAQADLKTAHVLFENDEFGPCAFFCQQAAEKALKALLYLRGTKVFGHSLVALLARIANEGYPDAGEAVKEAATSLDEHYINPRYPDAFEQRIPAEHYTADIAEEALRWAELLMQYSGEKLA
jgi:HEPN domain-containing protein